MADNMKTTLVNDALIMAIWKRKPKKGLLWHSDRGSQYASDSHRKLLGQRRFRTLFSQPKNRMREPRKICLAKRGDKIHLQLHRNLLQPTTPTFLQWLPVICSV